MPPLVIAVLLGAGAYVGYRAARRIYERTLGEPMPSPEDSNESVSSANKGGAKDLGALEFDPSSGAYRPVKRD
jgi:hypothetical protein